MNSIIPAETNHLKKINDYVQWLFKEKKDYVVIRKFNNMATNVTKLYLVSPVRERLFVTDADVLFNINTLKDVPIESIIETNTLYSGDIFKFTKLHTLLSKFTVSKTQIGDSSQRYQTKTKYKVFRNYTKTVEEQKNMFAFIQTGITPEESINSIYRLLHSKYVTVVEISYKSNINNLNFNSNGYNSL